MGRTDTLDAASSDADLRARQRRPRVEGARAPSRWLSLTTLIALIVGVLVCALAASAAATIVAQNRITEIRNASRSTIRPAQIAASALATAFANQQTGQLGFVLTGQPDFLEPYTKGLAAAKQLEAQLGRLIRDTPTRHLLAAVKTAGSNWQTNSVIPEIAARQLGPIPAEQTLDFGRSGSTDYQTLQSRLVALEAALAAQIAHASSQLDEQQRRQDVWMRASLGLAAICGLMCLVAVTFLLTRPLGRLVGQVRTVARGQYDRPISMRGPRELALLAIAAEQMRSSLLDGAANLAAARQDASLRQERDRMAADLHDRTVQRVYALGMSLGFMARRHPTLAGDLEAAMDETDEVVRELRSIVFAIGTEADEDSLRAGITDVVAQSVRALTFTPSVDFRGPVDVASGTAAADALLAVLRESLSNIARHAHARAVRVEVIVSVGNPAMLRLLVTDDGIGMPSSFAAGNGLRNIHERARNCGGSASIVAGPTGGTIIDWEAPFG